MQELLESDRLYIKGVQGGNEGMISKYTADHEAKDQVSTLYT